MALCKGVQFAGGNLDGGGRQGLYEEPDARKQCDLAKEQWDAVVRPANEDRNS